MSNPMIPLCRSIDTDRLYRSNTGSAKLLRCLMKAYNEINLGCFVPQFSIWTEGTYYTVGDIIFGRGEIAPDTLYCRHIWECKIAHTASQSDRPVDQTTLKWRKIGSTPTLFNRIAWPPCSILASSSPYGGLNKSPTGALIEVSGLTVLNGPQGPENAWHHDYNGIYCVHLGTMSWVDGSAWYQSGLCNGDLQWTMGFQGGGVYSDCGTGGSSRQLDIRQYKRTITDSWWTWGFLFCGSGQVVECETSYSLSNLFPQRPDPFPNPGTPEWNAWLQSLLPAKACCGPEYESWQWPSYNGYGGQLTFLGFCDYMSVGFDTIEIDYINGGTSAHCRWRFALWGAVNGVNTKRVILKDNIACDFFRYDFLGSDWDIFQGNTLIPLTPDGEGFFEYTVQVPEGSTVSDFGITNVNAYNWKYKGISDIFGSVWSS